MNRPILIASLYALVLLLTSCIQDDQPTYPDFTGYWVQLGVVEGHRYNYRLVHHGNKITGTIYGETRNAQAQITGTVDGKTATFGWSWPYNPSSRVTIEATIHDDGIMYNKVVGEDGVSKLYRQT